MTGAVHPVCANAPLEMGEKAYVVSSLVAPVVYLIHT